MNDHGQRALADLRRFYEDASEAVRIDLGPIVRSLEAAYRKKPATASDPVHLTPRELQIATLIAAEGLPNKIVAERLDMSQHTAKFHVDKLLKKLKVDNRTRLAIELVRRGLVTA